MKKDGITKLYDELTSEELASLAIHYLTELNELEVERIADAVPRMAYEGPDLDYQNRVQGFFDLAAGWGMEHWKTYTHLLAARVSLHITAGSGDREKVFAMAAAHGRWESRLLALEYALLAVCEEHGIDPDAVRRLAEAEPFTPITPDLRPDTEYQKEAQSTLCRVMSARPNGYYSPRSTPTPH